MHEEAQDEKVKILLHLPKKLVVKVHEHAAKNFRTISGEVSFIIEQQYKADESTK
jgi:hypothetical protein